MPLLEWETPVEHYRMGDTAMVETSSRREAAHFRRLGIPEARWRGRFLRQRMSDLMDKHSKTYLIWKTIGERKLVSRVGLPAVYAKTKEVG